MFYPKQSFPGEVRAQMRGGQGEITLTPLAGELPAHCRLFDVITVPAGASIGYHIHEGETEMYYFVSGQGQAQDDGALRPVQAGDVLVTGSGHGHGVQNTGTEPLVLVAVIVTEA